MLELKIKSPKQKTKDYPKLMIFENDTIVLMIRRAEGINLSSNNNEFSVDWDMSKFKDYNEEVTIKNK